MSVKNLRINQEWDPGISVVSDADLPRMLGEQGMQQLEEEVQGMEMAIERYGERAAVEALRRRRVLVEEEALRAEPELIDGALVCAGTRCQAFLPLNTRGGGRCRKDDPHRPLWVHRSTCRAERPGT